MLTQDQVPGILENIQQKLRVAAERLGPHLSVDKKDYKVEDEWLYVCVSPTVPGERASDHAELMSEIEEALREEGIDNVLLVPVVPD